MKWFWKSKEKEEASADQAEQREPASSPEPAAVSEAEPALSAQPLAEVVPRVPAAAPEPAPGEKKEGGLFQRLKAGLAKTRDFLNTDIDQLFAGGRKLDAELLEELEERLITADMGVQTTLALIERISKRGSKIQNAEDLKEVLREEILALLPKDPIPQAAVSKPRVLMVVGVNGVGKTTTIGKLAARAHDAGEKVIIAAADTFRAAAIEQLAVWAERAGADIVRHKDFADPAAVAFDAVTAAISRGADLVIVDTAGRLHTKVNLMEEMKKIKRTIDKVIPGAPHEILLVLDATTGQNAVSQARLFHEAVGITGLALTKLDGTAKGGIVISILHTMNIPLKYIGVGEGIEDLQDFDPAAFVDALF